MAHFASKAGDSNLEVNYPCPSKVFFCWGIKQIGTYPIKSYPFHRYFLLFPWFVNHSCLINWHTCLQSSSRWWGSTSQLTLLRACTTLRSEGSGRSCSSHLPRWLSSSSWSIKSMVCPTSRRLSFSLNFYLIIVLDFIVLLLWIPQVTLGNLSMWMIIGLIKLWWSWTTNWTSVGCHQPYIWRGGQRHRIVGCMATSLTAGQPSCL